MIHALSCPKGGLVLAWHNDAAKELDALSAWALNPLFISHKTKINSRTLQGEKNGAGTCVETGSQEGEVNENDKRAIGQAMVRDESREAVSVHFFWKWGTFALFDMQIVNLDTGSYLSQTSAKSMATVQKNKKDK